MVDFLTISIEKQASQNIFNRLDESLPCVLRGRCSALVAAYGRVGHSNNKKSLE